MNGRSRVRENRSNEDRKAIYARARSAGLSVAFARRIRDWTHAHVELFFSTR